MTLVRPELCCQHIPLLSAKLLTADSSARQALQLDATIETGMTVEPAPSTIEELMSRVQKGDMSAYQEIVRLYQRKVYRIISSYHRNPEDAREVLQDTFLKVYTARRSWERNRSFSAWICRIAINASIDRYRRGDRGKTTSLEGVLETQVRNPPGERNTRTPLDSVRDRERRRVLEAAVRRLPQRQREVVSLRYFAEMQLEEIAQTLNCPLGTVKSNLHKAVLALKDMLFGQKEVLIYE